jgi:uncharacterized protein YbbC (DUF1343 family)
MQIRTIILAMFLVLTMPLSAQVKFGIDNLIDTDFGLLRGKRVVLVTHAAARTYRGSNTAEEFLQRRDVTTLRLLAPEHGFFGVVPAGVTVADDTVMNTPVVSLYGRLRRPDRSMISDADVVVIDLQDIGVRSYTYISTMVEVLEACAEAGIRCMVLDRPNPLGGAIVQGNLPDEELRSFIGRIPVPYIHGMTMGELATMVNEKGWLSVGPNGTARECNLTVVKCKRWKRSMTWEDIDRPWYPTSPNIPSVHAIRGYVLTGMVGELGACSIGMGTTTPFTLLGGSGFPIDSLLVLHLRRYGVVAARARFKPSSGKYAQSICDGYHLLPQRATWQPYNAALTVLWRVREQFREAFPDTLAAQKNGVMFAKACGSADLVQAFIRGASLGELERIGRRGVDVFIEQRRQFLLYD